MPEMRVDVPPVWQQIGSPRFMSGKEGLVRVCDKRKGALALSAAAALACAAQSGKAATFTDNYSSDTTANYNQSNDPGPAPSAGLVHTWAVSGGTLNYSRTSTVATADNWATSIFVTKPTVASTAGMSSFTTEGDIIGNKNFVLSASGANSQYFQPGLVISGDATKGGFVVAEYENGKFQYHFVLLRETGGQLVGDEGGTGTPPVLADFGSFKNFLTDNFHVQATEDLTGPHPAFHITLTDTTAGFSVTKDAIDAGDPSTFGGNSVGWRVRYHLNDAALSFDNLTLEAAVPEPATLGLLAIAGGALLARRRRA